ncbi:peptide chain release factor N(5)-glutamine methyltransferase [Aliiroseovarius sp. YM-037]|uniref:peptide chain release factor N(5)-glutamine methyltransferase n=1 Tax=Aliiroseovarius sp. YM-037 TaxID=3341728 RepID=UPI003A80ACE8
MTTAQDALRDAVQRLRAAGVNDPARDARVLLAHALGISRDRLTLVMPDDMPDTALDRFNKAITAREARQPVAQITGRRAFFGRDFIVTPDVLDPRPETELLVEAALSRPGDRVLDLGTGSGCILLSVLAERASATGLGVDASKAALDVARRNATALGVADRATFQSGDWLSGITGPVDLILSNPPYVTEAEMAALSPEVANWEPAEALTPGGDGLAAYRTICADAPNVLAPQGWLIVEIGSGQADLVAGLFGQAGFQKIEVKQDLAGHNRVVLGQLG